MNEQNIGNKNDIDPKIMELEAQIVDLTNNWKRALADYKNLQKRTEEERVAIVRYANENLILRLLFVLDNLNLMKEHSDDQGLALIAKEFEQILKDEGLEEIKTEKQEFNPKTMEAIEMVEGNKKDKGKVVEIVQKGYMLKDKVLRATKVKVGE